MYLVRFLVLLLCYTCIRCPQIKKFTIINNIINRKMISVETVPGMGREDEGEWWKVFIQV
jgi:hypothetical protein